MRPPISLPRLAVALVGAFAATACGGGGGGGSAATSGPPAPRFEPADVRLETDGSPGRSESAPPRIAADGDLVAVVWSDVRAGKAAVFVRVSTDGGASWGGGDLRVDHKPVGTSDAARPRIAVAGTVLHVVWEDHRDGGPDVYYNRSRDGGATWLSEDRRLDTDAPGAAASEDPELAVDGDGVVVVWSDGRTLRSDVRANRSLDGGESWLATDRRLDTDLEGAAASVVPQVAFAGGVPVVVWADGRDDFTDVRGNRSTDGGATWLGRDVRLDSDAPGVSPSAAPRIATDGNDVLVVWQDGRSGRLDVRANRSRDAGASWLAHDVRVDTDPAGVAASVAPVPSLAGGRAYVAWQDGRDGFVDVRFRRSFDAGATWVGADRRLDGGGAGLAPSQDVDVAASGDTVVVVWQDGVDGGADVHVRRSLDAGATFSPTVRADTDPPGRAASVRPRVSLRGGLVRVVWLDARDGAFDVRFNRGF